MIKEKCSKQKNKTLNKGFTLIELLVVVLIIGILAAIALPQYKMAVAKSKYNSVKETTEIIVSSVNRYYLSTNTFPANLEVLDIDLVGEYQTHQHIQKARIELSNGNICGFNIKQQDLFQEVLCFTHIGNKSIAYSTRVSFLDLKPAKKCYAISTDPTDIVNKICQKETGKKPTANPGCGGSCYEYFY